MSIKAEVKFSCGAECNGKTYLASVEGNDLYEYDSASGKLTYVNFFEEEKDTIYLYVRAIAHNKYVWFIPQTADNIAVVNTDTYSIEYIKLPYTWMEDSVYQKCASAGIFNGHFLYIVPYDIDSLIIIDMDTREMKVYSDICSKNKKYIDAYYNDGNLYLVPWTAENMLQINVETGDKRELAWKWGKKQYSSAKADYQSNTVWFAPAGADSILVYDILMGEWLKIAYNKISSPHTEYINSNDIKIYGEKIFILPFEAENIISIDRNTKKVNYYPYGTSEASIPFFKLIDNCDMCAIIESTNQMFSYDMEKDLFYQKNIVVETKKSIEHITVNKINKKIKEKEKIMESQFVLLESYLDYLELQNK